MNNQQRLRNMRDLEWKLNDWFNELFNMYGEDRITKIKECLTLAKEIEKL